MSAIAKANAIARLNKTFKLDMLLLRPVWFFNRFSENIILLKFYFAPGFQLFLQNAKPVPAFDMSLHLNTFISLRTLSYYLACVIILQVSCKLWLESIPFN